MDPVSPTVSNASKKVRYLCKPQPFPYCNTPSLVLECTSSNSKHCACPLVRSPHSHSLSMDSKHENTNAPTTTTPLHTNGVTISQKHFQQPKFLPNWDSAHACNSPGDATHFLKRNKRKQNDKTPRTLRSWIVDNQTGVISKLEVWR